MQSFKLKPKPTLNTQETALKPTQRPITAAKKQQTSKQGKQLSLNSQDRQLLADFSQNFGNNLSKLDREIQTLEDQLTLAKKEQAEARAARLKSQKIKMQDAKGNNSRQKGVSEENERLKKQIKELEAEVKLQTQIIQHKMPQQNENSITKEKNALQDLRTYQHLDKIVQTFEENSRDGPPRKYYDFEPNDWKELVAHLPNILAMMDYQIQETQKNASRLEGQNAELDKRIDSVGGKINIRQTALKERRKKEKDE